MKMRRYSELAKLETYEERFEYLKLNGEVGSATFGFDRYLNQNFYKSQEWRRVRDEVILRDNGCDLGVAGYELDRHIIIHHMNPIRIEDILNRKEDIFNPEYLICVSHNTHNAIHYGDKNLLRGLSTKREPNDTCPWKR